MEDRINELEHEVEKLKISMERQRIFLEGAFGEDGFAERISKKLDEHASKLEKISKLQNYLIGGLILLYGIQPLISELLCKI